MKLSKLIDSEYHKSRDYLVGRILTIIDASIADPEQRKGIKDLIKEAAYNLNADWFFQRINIIINQFNEKFGKIPASKKDSYYLNTGEWLYEEGEAQLAPPSSQNYFSEE